MNQQMLPASFTRVSRSLSANLVDSTARWMNDRSAMSTEPDVSDLISVQQAIDIIDATPIAPREREMNLADAQGLRLAQDIVADRDYPPFDKSLMDGFAVRCVDVEKVPAVLNVVDEIPAGKQSSREVLSGEAIAIMTGAPLP